MRGDDAVSEALERTMTRCAGTVRGVASRHGLTGQDVEEVFQEVRIRLWRSLRTSEKIGEVPASYVYRAAMSAALDMIRRRRVRKEDELLADGTTGRALASAVPGPERVLVQKETGWLVERALERLIDSRRPVVRMHLLGYKLEEIAELMGWTRDKARNLLYRGLSDLRSALSEMEATSEGIA